MTKTLVIDPAKNPKKAVPAEGEGEIVSYVNCAPRISPQMYLEILDMNMTVLRKEFGPGWTKTKKIGSIYSEDEMRRAVDARYAFIKRWYDLLESDLYLLDHISRVRGFDRQHTPGVITSITINPAGRLWAIRLLIRGKPLQVVPKDELKWEVERLLMNDDDDTIDGIQKKIEYYLRDHGYEVLEISEELSIEV